MKKFFKTAWAWLDGNKTIIGAGVLLALDQWGMLLLSAPWLLGAKILVSVLTGVALGHHAKKGYFTTAKGG
jgi:hypothetical protein